MWYFETANIKIAVYKLGNIRCINKVPTFSYKSYTASAQYYKYPGTDNFESYTGKYNCESLESIDRIYINSYASVITIYILKWGSPHLKYN
jgi:hypothetical protein